MTNVELEPRRKRRAVESRRTLGLTRCTTLRSGRGWLVPSLLVVSAAVFLLAWTAAAAPMPSGKQVDAASRGFGLHMKLTLLKQWRVLPADGGGPPPAVALALVHVGSPATDQSQWWGPDIMIVNGARVHRAADAVSNKPAAPDASAFVPWPSDFFDYLTSLPRVKVLAPPRSVTIGGIRGTQFTIQTPPMHPIIWLKGDSAWIGGGRTGVDPAMTRRITLINVKGKTLLLGFGDSSANFKTRSPMVSKLFSTIRF